MEKTKSVTVLTCEGRKAVADGKVGDPTLQGRFEKNPERSLPRRAAQHYLYIKRAWVEFLGEPLTSRRRSRVNSVDTSQ